MNNDIYKSIIDGSPYGYACYKLDRYEDSSYYFILVETNKAFSDLTGIDSALLTGPNASVIFPFDLGEEKDRLKLIGDIAMNGGSCEFWKYIPERKKELRVKVLSAKDRHIALVIYESGILAGESLKQSEEHLRMVLDSAAEGIFGADLDGNCTFCNVSCLKMLGYEKEFDLLGQNIYAKIRFTPNSENGCMPATSPAGPAGHSEDGTFYRADGVSLPVEYFWHPQYQNADVVGSVVTFFDISARKKSEKELRESERSKATLISNIPGMAYRCKFDREWTMQFVSEGCFALTGYRSESLLGNSEVSFNELILPEFREHLWEQWNESLKLRNVVREEYPIRTASGETKWVFEQGRGVYDENGNIEALEGLIIDITDRKKKEEDIRYLNYHDTLTGLYNRMYYEEAEAKMDTPGSLPLSVLVGDINGLKLINDAFGHAKGDKLILETARLLKSCCREKDVLARTGGDEFCILMPNTDSEEAYEMIIKVQTACGIYNNKSASEAYSINISLGFATKKTDSEFLSEIVKSAEDHMYKRKLLEHKSSRSAIVSAIKATMFEKNRNTEQHAERISGLSKKLGAVLGLSRGDLDDLELLAALHDIGKVGIDENILNKPGALNAEEIADIRKHPEIGYRIAMASPELVSIADYILTHQERWDGAGYPLGLRGEGIPLLSRIIAVVDCYDSITHDKPYRKALTMEQAAEEIRKNAGIQFDPRITEKFLEMIRRMPEEESASGREIAGIA